MTEYGRGPGPEPWHPDDPLFGDGGWTGQQAQMGQQSPYGDQPQHYPQQHQPQYDEWGRPYYPQQQYDQQYPGGSQQPPQYDGSQQPPQYDGDGWGTGTHQQVPDPGHADPYGQQTAAYGGGDQSDYYGGPGPEAYPPPEPPSRGQTEPEPPQTDWDPGPDQGEHAFFADGGDDDDGDGDDGGGRGRPGRGRGRGGKPKKRRNGCACLVVVAVLGGGIAGVGYFGYEFYQNRFGDAPDYAGDGTGQSVTVQIPKGASGADIGRRLKEAGVVKSVDAFVAAQADNPDGETLQAGAYLLKKQMSAASAVELMLDPKSQNNIMVTPGQRNVQVYKAIDAKLGLSDGSTEKLAGAKYKSLGLPEWANNSDDIKDPLEGFLRPGTYPAAKGMKPETILKDMVAQANKQYDSYDLAAKARGLKLENPLELVTVASLVQAEGKTHDDFRKMAEVVYNRLKPTNTETNQLLQFDSTFNYLRGESNIHISESEINSNQDPYNTYTRRGLPPGPIGNPGEDALKAALNPTGDGWIYFVATDGVHNTEFAKTYAEFERLKDKFNESSGN
ncbi:endolytic transglycosylase MltG [Streptomyces sp. NPDC005925]|uniref:endolytic transglycosylase MltG n=1 Tax=Streptomyces sp. NPDC005925 TaxID=3157172 RepID=UPI0033F8D987